MPRNDKIETADWMSLLKEEDVVWWNHPSLIPFIPEIIGGFLISIASIVIPIYLGVELTQTVLLIIAAGFLGGLLFAGYEYLRYMSIFYVVTTTKVVKKVGIIRRDTLNVQYEEIQHVRANQSPIERLLGFGDIQIATAGTGVNELYLDNVNEPRRVKDYITDGVDDGTVNEF